MDARTEAALRQRLDEATELTEELADTVREALLLIGESPRQRDVLEDSERRRNDSLRDALASIEERRHRRLVLMED